MATWRAHRIHLNLLRVSPRPSALFCLPSGLLTQDFKYIHTPNDIHSLLNISDLFWWNLIILVNEILRRTVAFNIIMTDIIMILPMVAWRWVFKGKTEKISEFPLFLIIIILYTLYKHVLSDTNHNSIVYHGLYYDPLTKISSNLPSHFSLWIYMTEVANVGVMEPFGTVESSR